jgi:hypothetical protein
MASPLRITSERGLDQAHPQDSETTIPKTLGRYCAQPIEM